MRALGRALLTLALLIGGYFAAALVGGLVPGAVAEVAAEGAETEIRLIAGPIHYDFMLPATPGRLAAYGFAADAGVPLDDPRAAWLVVGWGARDFYTTTGTMRDVALASVWQAATGDASVLRLDVLGPLDEDVGRPVTLSAGQVRALDAAILATFDGTVPLDHPGLTGSDAFFPARGRFHLFRTCNSWVSEMLRAAGVPMGVWTPTPYAVTLGLPRDP